MFVLAGDAATSTSTFSATADSYVSQSKPSTNFGTAKDMQAASSPVLRSYVRFNVDGLSGSVQKAILRVLVKSASTTGLEVRSVGTTGWDEKTITNSNAPAPSEAYVGKSGPFGSAKWVDLDVTSQVSGNGVVSFAISTASATPISMSTREQNPTNAPRLLIDTFTPDRAGQHGQAERFGQRAGRPDP